MSGEGGELVPLRQNVAVAAGTLRELADVIERGEKVSIVCVACTEKTYYRLGHMSGLELGYQVIGMATAEVSRQVDRIKAAFRG